MLRVSRTMPSALGAGAALGLVCAPTATAAPASGAALYENWAGYQVRAAAPQAVHAAWVVPRPGWPGRDGYSNLWVGLGGGNATQGQLLQAGTEHDVVCTGLTKGRCSKWRTSTYLWIETFPQRAQERITNLTVSPGDSVSVSVRWNAGTRRAEFTLCNARLARCVTTSRATSAPRGVAEFVLERPSRLDGRPLALANVGVPRFTAMSVATNGRTYRPKQLANTRITMFNGRPLAVPGALSPLGDAFAVAFRRAA